jgi:hypothetical protein
MMGGWTSAQTGGDMDRASMRIAAFTLLRLAAYLTIFGSCGSSHNGAACFVEDSIGSNLSDGCFCYLDPNDPNIAKETRKRVTSCRASDVGPQAICCKDTKNSCGCFQTNCEVLSITGNCNCSIIDSNETASCQTGTRCCISSDGSCGCDSLDTQCPAVYGQTNVPSCVAAQLTPSCDQFGDVETQVASCSD